MGMIEIEPLDSVVETKGMFKIKIVKKIRVSMHMLIVRSR